jgi:hypothetical protein
MHGSGLLMPHGKGRGIEQCQDLEGPNAERGGHAVAILEATVLSLSNFSLFRLNACCRQSSRLLHAWCSGNRCCQGQSTLERVNRGQIRPENVQCRKSQSDNEGSCQ